MSPLEEAMKLARRRRSWAMVTGVAVASLALTACSAGSLGSSSGGSGTTITFLVDNGDATVAMTQALIKDFNAKNDGIMYLFFNRQIVAGLTSGAVKG